MAKTLFLCGHGGWKMKDGFTSLPKGVSFTFYSHAHKTIYQSAVEEIVAGNYAGWSDEFSEYQNIQNMTLHPDDPPNIPPTKNALKNNPDKNARVYFAKKAVTLKTFFRVNADWIRKNAPVHFVWTCCRYTEVKKTQSFGGQFGVNASEDLLNSEYDIRDFDRNILRSENIL